MRRRRRAAQRRARAQTSLCRQTSGLSFISSALAHSIEQQEKKGHGSCRHKGSTLDPSATAAGRQEEPEFDHSLSTWLMSSTPSMTTAERTLRLNELANSTSSSARCAKNVSRVSCSVVQFVAATHVAARVGALPPGAKMGRAAGKKRRRVGRRCYQVAYARERASHLLASL